MTDAVPRKHVLLGVTGSVAAIKTAEIVRTLSASFDVRVVATERALHFIRTVPGDLGVPLYTDVDEWTAWKQRGDPVMHIELRRWADVFLIAPLDANTLAKMATGLCDNLLTCVARAWDFSRPLLLAPAMNTFMWNHPLTAEQLGKLERFGATVIPPIEKRLICGDSGVGAMADVSTVCEAVRAAAAATAARAPPQHQPQPRAAGSE